MTASNGADALVRRGFSLGAYEVRPALNRVDGPTGTSRLEPRAMAVLVCLARQAGLLVPRDDLIWEVWGSEGAADDLVSRAISAIRKALGETSRDARLVETIPKGGYRLTVIPELLAAGDVAAPWMVEEPVIGPSPAVVAVPDPVAARDRRSRFPRPGAVAAGTLLALLVVTGGALLRSPIAPASEDPSLRLSDNARPLATLDGDEVHPSVSPDGARVAFAWRPAGSRYFDLRIIGLEGDIQLPAASFAPTSDAHEISPAWSPDGRYLAFIRVDDTPCRLVVADVATGHETTIYTCGEGRFDRLRWSQTGEFMVLRGRSTPTESSRLWRLDIDPHDPAHRVKHGPVAITSPPPQTPGDDAFAITNDGTTVVLSRLEVESVSDLFRLDLRTGDLTRLTRRRQPVFDLTVAERGQVWVAAGWGTELGIWEVSIADGSAAPVVRTETELHDLAGGPASPRLVFRREHNDVDLMRVALDGASVTAPPILGSTRADSKPAISPDGRLLAFESNRSGPYEIWVSDRDGAGARQLTRLGGAYNGFPRWSPSGAQIVFEARPNGQSDVYVVDVAGGEPRRLTTDHAQDITPSWSPDGASVLFASDRTGRWEVWRRQVRSGIEDQITSSGGLAPLVSPDDGHVYYAKSHEAGIWRRRVSEPVVGDEELVLDAVTIGDYAAWTLAGGRIIYLERLAGGRACIRSLDLATGTIRKIGETRATPAYYGGIAVSADGAELLVAVQSRLESDLASYPIIRPEDDQPIPGLESGPR